MKIHSTWSHRLTAIALATSLAGCSSAPKPGPPLPPTLAEVNRALATRFADVTLTNRVVMHGLRAVEVTPETLAWTNESGQRREMPIAEVARIELRGRDPAAKPPGAGALSAAATPPAEPDVLGPPISGSFSGDSALAVGAVYGALYLLNAGIEEPGVVIYEGPVSRYLPAPVASAPENTASSSPPRP